MQNRLLRARCPLAGDNVSTQFILNVAFVDATLGGDPPKPSEKLKKLLDKVTFATQAQVREKITKFPYPALIAEIWAAGAVSS